jgi:hypothetical protein
MARPKVVTALAEWMRDTWRTDAELARELSAHPKLKARGRSIGQRQIAHWRKGHSMPFPIYVEVLRELSDGKVTGDSFLDGVIMQKDQQNHRARKAKKPTESVRRAGARRDDVHPRSTSSVDDFGQGLLSFYKPSTLREKLDASAEAPLRPSKGQKTLPKSGLFGR